MSRTADVGLAAAAAGLSGHGAGTTIDGTTAAIADRSAVCALLLAGERVAGTGSALIRALRTANLTLRARAALNDLSASIGDRTALGIEVAAILRLAGITTEVRARASAHTAVGTRTAIDGSTATIADPSTFGANIVAVERLAGRLAADIRLSASAAGLTRLGAAAAVDLLAATVTRETAVKAEVFAGKSRALADTALVGDAARTAGLSRRTITTVERTAAAIAEPATLTERALHRGAARRATDARLVETADLPVRALSALDGSSTTVDEDAAVCAEGRARCRGAGLWHALAAGSTIHSLRAAAAAIDQSTATIRAEPANRTVTDIVFVTRRALRRLDGISLRNACGKIEEHECQRLLLRREGRGRSAHVREVAVIRVVTRTGHVECAEGDSTTDIFGRFPKGRIERELLNRL